jgi:ABC-2 type transport system ATP-binding protein
MNVIEIRNLTKNYGRSRGIREINMEVEEGEIFGFIGPNGAGKSTTIRLLLNLIFPTSGHARMLGLDVVKDAKAIKRDVGYVPSDANLYDRLTVGEFFRYCADYFPGRVSAKRMTELSDTLELDLGRKMEELSLGNRKKVAIVQSLLHSPRLLILDEPTTGLDPLIQSRLFHLLRSENEKGTSIFFSSHILSDVQTLCRRVAIIKDGKIIQVEDIDSLRSRQLKKVTVRFDGAAVPESIPLDGASRISINEDREVRFVFSGAMNDLVRFLAGQNIKSLVVEDPSLEEIFMHYYQ